MITMSLQEFLLQAETAAQAAAEGQSRADGLEQDAEDFLGTVQPLIFGETLVQPITQNPFFLLSEKYGIGLLGGGAVALLEDVFARRAECKVTAADFDSTVALAISLLVMAVARDRELSAESLED